MTPIEYRRLCRLLQRERRKGARAFDQLTDLAARDGEDMEPDGGPGRVGPVGADRGVGPRGGRLQGDSSR